MVKPYCTRFSYYKINNTHDLSSKKYYRLPFHRNLELVYDLKNKKGIAVVSRIICSSPKKKLERNKKLRDFFTGIKASNSDELQGIIKKYNKQLINIFI